MAAKLIAVTGATGAQGGGLVRAILADPRREFAVRAITRKTDSPKAAELKKLGAEVVAADLDDAASLKAAFSGAHGVYGVTNFWEHFSADREIVQAGNIARAAREAGVKHVIWSTLEDTRLRVPLSDPRMPTLKEKWKVPHFDGKGEADRLFKDLPATLLLTSFYWDNLIHFGMGPKKGPDGKLAFTLPMADKKLPGIAASDIGGAAFAIFMQGKTGNTVGIAGDHLTGTEMAAELTKALGQPVVYNAVTPATYRSFGFPGADDLGNMFQYKAEFEKEFCGARDLKAARALHPGLQTFAQWLAANKQKISIA